MRNAHSKSCLCILFLCVYVVSAPYRGVAFQSPPPIAEQAHRILESRCAECHHQGGIGASKLKIEKFADVQASGFVIPKDLSSKLLTQVEQGFMPLGKPKLSAPEIAAIREWILQGAPNWEASPSLSSRAFVSEAQILQLIRTDLKKQSELSHRDLRYYSLVHLYNAGASDADLEQYRVGLAKLVNSLSRRPDIVVPSAINPERTLLRIDLHLFKWDDAIWKTIVRAYPYGVKSAGSEEIRQITGADIPYIRADWFVFQASTPPLYDDILQLPSTISELETQQEVRLNEDFQKNHLLRAGMTVSGVSDHNRIIERHASVNGAYWRSYDFLTSQGEENILENPLTFKAAGGEIIFNLPNGLQAYLLADAKGKRLDGPANPKIVHDDTGGIDPQVTNGRSCMGCHYKGMQDAKDFVRSAALNSDSFPSHDKVLAVYRGQKELNDLLKADDKRFERAILATGGKIVRPEPVNELSKKYHQALTLELAAAELGLPLSVFKQSIRDNPTLANFGFGVLLQPGGTYQRDTWEGNFPKLVSSLRLGSPAEHVLIRDSTPTAPAPPPTPAPVRPPAPAPTHTYTPTQPSAPVSKVNPKDGQRYMFIPPGRFTMGCSPGDNECDGDEKPAHEVAIAKGFYIGQTAVTQAAYERVTGQNPSHFKGANLPVETVSWNEAQSYCQAAGMRLPTEAEWEYAARAGSTASRYGAIDQIAWHRGNSGGRTQEVGQKTPNAFGLYDMLGNVFQWTADLYDATDYALRGGSWVNVPRMVRVSVRGRSGPEVRNLGVDVGLRCVGN